MHYPPDLEEIIKPMSAWTAISNGYDAIGLLKVVCDAAHDQTEAKQTVTGFMESTVELFTYHQDKKLSNDYYSIMFNATVESIKAHDGRP